MIQANAGSGSQPHICALSTQPNGAITDYPNHLRPNPSSAMRPLRLLRIPEPFTTTNGVSDLILLS